MAQQNLTVTTLHATGDVTGDTGLRTTLGGVDTNYVNVNSLLLRKTDGAGELWFKNGPADTDWTKLA